MENQRQDSKSPKQMGQLEQALNLFDERIDEFTSIANRIEALADQLFGGGDGKDKVSTDQDDGLMGTLIHQTKRFDSQRERISDALSRLEGLV